MEKYGTGLIINDYTCYPKFPYKGKGWHLSLENTPFANDSFGGSNSISGVKQENKELVINAQSLDKAQDVANLVTASLSLFDGYLSTAELDLTPQPLTNEDFIGRSGLSRSNIPDACLIARKSSFRLSHQFGIFKYYLSQKTFPTNGLELDPARWDTSKFVFSSPEFLVRCATSITTAYSVLEELELEIRASHKNPSKMRGKWNPKVYQELESRLKRANINTKEKFVWIIRDTPTKIDKTNPPPKGAKTTWTYGKVRDREIDIIDAIAYASWLRSRVSAHKLKDISKSLNYYNVYNVQWLARVLLLSKLGFWG